MKPAMRSLREETSGEGLKSIIWTLRHTAIAGEELSLGLEQPGELDLIDVWQGAFEHPRALAAGDLRGDGEKELVGEAALAQPAVQRRAALTEHGLDAALGEQPLERAVQLNALWMPDDGHRGGSLRRLLIRGLEDHDAATSVGEEAGVPGELQPVGDDHRERVMRQEGALAVGAQRRVRDHPAVALRPHGPCADHHRVDAGA